MAKNVCWMSKTLLTIPLIYFSINFSHVGRKLVFYNDSHLFRGIRPDISWMLFGEAEKSEFKLLPRVEIFRCNPILITDPEDIISYCQVNLNWTLGWILSVFEIWIFFRRCSVVPTPYQSVNFKQLLVMSIFIGNYVR